MGIKLNLNKRFLLFVSTAFLLLGFNVLCFGNTFDRQGAELSANDNDYQGKSRGTLPSGICVASLLPQQKGVAGFSDLSLIARALDQLDPGAFDSRTVTIPLNSQDLLTTLKKGVMDLLRTGGMTRGLSEDWVQGGPHRVDLRNQLKKFLNSLSGVDGNFDGQLVFQQKDLANLLGMRVSVVSFLVLLEVLLQNIDQTTQTKKIELQAFKREIQAYDLSRFIWFLLNNEQNLRIDEVRSLGEGSDPLRKDVFDSMRNLIW